ncbi:hypothetical protein SAZ11_30165 [Streptomyces sp. FXJ1.4098]|nr:hypothetical protein [Streptomyces sp. FXJ1.4098]
MRAVLPAFEVVRLPRDMPVPDVDQVEHPVAVAPHTGADGGVEEAGEGRVAQLRLGQHPAVALRTKGLTALAVQQQLGHRALRQ